MHLSLTIRVQMLVDHVKLTLDCEAMQFPIVVSLLLHRVSS